MFRSLRLVSSRYRRSPCLRTSSTSIARAALLGGLGIGAQSLERFIERGQRSAPRRLRRRQVLDPRYGRGGVVGQLSGPLVQFDVIGQQPRAFHAHALQLALQLFAPRDHLLDMRLDPSRGGLFRTQALVQTGQFRAHVRMLFADRVGARLQTLVLAARELPELFPGRSAPVRAAPRPPGSARAAGGNVRLLSQGVPAPGEPPKGAGRNGRILRPTGAARDRAPARPFPAAVAARGRAPVLRPAARSSFRAPPAIRSACRLPARGLPPGSRVRAVRASAPADRRSICGRRSRRGRDS